MLNYNKSSIYKLCCRDLNITEIYVGSTTNFNRRRNQHKSACKCLYKSSSKYSTYKLYQFIRDNGGWDNWTMVLLEKYNCDNKIELHTRERYWIEELKADLNCIIPTRTQKEYVEDNKEKISIRKKIYTAKNTEKKAKYDKIYRAENFEHRKEYDTKIYNEKKNKKIKCGCGSSYLGYCKSKIKKHEATPKHQKWLSTIVYIIIED
jgi:hypothetical protein